jgi:hypothetical protein
MAATATRDKVIAEALETSSQVSALVRATAAGVLAIAWGFLLTPAERFPGPAPIVVLTVIGLVILGMITDWAQYLFAHIDSRLRERAMVADPQLRGWDPGSFCYKCRGRCFIAKQVLVGLAALLLVGGLAPSIVRLAASSLAP